MQIKFHPGILTDKQIKDTMRPLPQKETNKAGRQLTETVFVMKRSFRSYRTLIAPLAHTLFQGLLRSAVDGHQYSVPINNQTPNSTTGRWRGYGYANMRR